ncbi:hypothetical protein [Actinoplanes sp. NPDC049681]|uniref:hypothetical protein n=1 Tax=Actinoplanes sp. NPDC049681 TaxID=3363905 RepID=UPI0037BB35BF
MIAVSIRPGAPRTAVESSRTPLLLAALPWILAAAVFAGALLVTGTPGGDVAIYAVYLVAGIVVPGTLVHRALRGSRGNLPEDVGLGAATGLVVQLAGWALAAATGLQPLLRWWPAVVIAVFVGVPRWRRHWRTAEPSPLPLRWSWMVCGVLIGVVALGVAAWTTTPLPPADTVYYPDLMYHLALVHEMTRSMPFEVPQLAGDPLRYHYLSDADMAAASMITGIAPTTVLLRLWMVPIGATAVVVLAALTRDVSGRWWAGPPAAGVALLGLPLVLGAPIQAYGGTSLSFSSPSQTYAMPLLALLVTIAVGVLRGERLGAAWILVPPLALACAGAKSSSLPPLVVGLLLAGVAVARDRVRLRATVALLGLVVAAMLLGMRLFAGGGAGTLGVQPLSLLRWMEPYTTTLGRFDGVVPGGLLPPGVRQADAGGRYLIAGIIVWWLVFQSPRLLGIAGLPARGLRRDPAAWLLAGTTAAGTGAAWLLWHPSASQLYFFLCAAPFGAVLTAWLLAGLTRRWWVPASGFVAGAAWAVLAPAVPPPQDQTSVAEWGWTLALPALHTLPFVAAAAVVLLILRKRPRALAAAVVAAVLGAGLATGVAVSVEETLRAGREQPPTARLLTQEEMRAALWLDDHAGVDDLVATNVHCVPMGRYEPCDARAFWVAGLGGRRTLVESWAYSDAALAANGLDGLKYVLQPPPDPVRYELNQRVFTEAYPVGLRALRAAGVRWLFADSRAGEVSPDLARLARLRYTSGPVGVYELTAPPR